MLGYAGALCRRACLMLRDFVTLRGRPPRAPNLIAGLLIDDLILLDFVRKELPREPFSPRRSEPAAGFCRHGLQKGLWNRLLGEVPAYLRDRGEEDLGCRESGYEHHPASAALFCWGLLSKPGSAGTLM